MVLLKEVYSGVGQLHLGCTSKSCPLTPYLASSGSTLARSDISVGLASIYTFCFSNTKSPIGKIEIYLLIHHCIRPEDHPLRLVDINATNKSSFPLPSTGYRIVLFRLVAILHVSFRCYLPMHSSIQFECYYWQLIELFKCVLLKSIAVLSSGDAFPGNSERLLWQLFGIEVGD